MKVLHCLVVAMSLCAATAYAQGNHAHPSAAENVVASQDASANQVIGRVEQQKPVEKKDECVGPVSFCNIYFGS
ncbi:MULTISPECIES: hypothetical protein [unclassified Paraburkholderia]|uniref:hypothetical protein n=1 Tax=unclassified Paraburkholderia TaxID=2615204 RepID=UPI00197D55DB|nr:MULTISPECIES: hypothetical protein [unclassified Paraburkholderia]MBN3856322.1 hypothetical protein [Paraburkholderia sp. Ac-20340]